MFRYYNVHTHHAGSEPDCCAILNRSPDFGAPAVQACSMGLHPWYLEHAETDMAALTRYATDPLVLAVGECGLDRVRGAAWARQEQFFGQQIALANRLCKPLLIHCVRAFDDALRMLQQANVPVVFHGFGKKAAVAQQVLAAGHYLSFGMALLRENSTAAAVLAQVPADRFFLETDDDPGSIRPLYAAAAEIRKTTEDAVILQLQRNFKTVFQP